MKAFTTEQINRLQGDNANSGIALAIVQGGQIAYSAGFGSVTAETPFEVASLSKPLFAYGVLQLCERGILNLDTPISHYLPEAYIIDEPNLPFITVRHALSHTTGFPNWRDAAGLRTGSPAGSKFFYSTEGLIYLQTAVEQVIQQPFHEYARQHIFEPFGMVKSEYIAADMSRFPDYLPRHLYSFGAVSLKTTAPDYARFLIQMLGSGVPNSACLSETMLADMLKPVIPVGNQAGLFWGLGWGLYQNTFWHWGQRHNLNRNFAMGSRETGLGVVILTNHENGLSLCESIVEWVMDYPAYPAFKWLLPADKWRPDGYNAEN